MNTAERKKLLIAQGALHRVEIVLGRHAVRSSLRPEALARDAIQQLAGAAPLAFLGRTAASGLPGNLSILLPFVVRAAGYLVRNKRARKPVLQVAVAAGAALAAFTLFKRSRH